jgi:hypothetical protein
MADDELMLVWRHLDLLHQAVGELIELERAALASRPATPDEPAMPPPSPALDAVAGQLDALRERLRPAREEVGRHAAAEEKRRFAEIDVERINVVAPDGSPRLILSNKERAPDPVTRGKAGKRQGGNAAGLIFYNEEGDECGGLTFGGKREGDQYAAEGALLFDQFQQDQVVGIMHEDVDGKRRAGLYVWDRADLPLDEWVERIRAVQRLPKGPEQNQAFAQLRAEGWFGATRLFAGKMENRSTVISLQDPNDQERLRLAVAADGAASIEFLDESGRVTHRIPEVESEGAP